MIVATLKALTWGTVATAVISAFLLATGGGGMPRVERGDDAQTGHSAAPATSPMAGHRAPKATVQGQVPGASADPGH